VKEGPAHFLCRFSGPGGVQYQLPAVHMGHVTLVAMLLHSTAGVLP